MKANWVLEQPSQSRFRPTSRIRLPRGPKKPNTIDPSASEDKKITVLIIDDQPESRRSIRESLPAGYRWIEASSGEEGLRLAVGHVPDSGCEWFRLKAVRSD